MQIKPCFGGTRWHELRCFCCGLLNRLSLYLIFIIIIVFWTSKSPKPINKILCAIITIQHNWHLLRSTDLSILEDSFSGSDGFGGFSLSLCLSHSLYCGQQWQNCPLRYHLLCWDNCLWVGAHQDEKLKLFPRTQAQWTVEYKRWWISIFPWGSAYDRGCLD